MSINILYISFCKIYLIIITNSWKCYEDSRVKYLILACFSFEIVFWQNEIVRDVWYAHVLCLSTSVSYTENFFSHSYLATHGGDPRKIFTYRFLYSHFSKHLHFFNFELLIIPWFVTALCMEFVQKRSCFPHTWYQKHFHFLTQDK